MNATQSNIQASFPSYVFRNDYHAIAVHKCGWLFIEEFKADGKRRHAEISISEMMPDNVTYKSHQKVCDVYYDRKGYGDNATYVGEINWSAWGSQDALTTKRFAECLLAGTELLEAYAEGFSFI